MKDLIEALQKLLPWMAGLPLAPKIAVSLIVVAFAALLLALIWTPATEQGAASSTGLTQDRAAARFGVTLGWQLGRFEFIDGSPVPKAQQAAPELKRQILQLLAQQNFPHRVDDLNAQQTINSVLTYYGTTDLKIHASILLGLGAQRASMVGASSDSASNAEMAALAASAIESIDRSIVNAPKSLAKTLVSKKPATIEAVLDVFDDWSRQPTTN